MDIKQILSYYRSLKSPLITFVWAEDENGVIGYQNKLPWHIPEEMAWFKEVTMGDTVVMGRKTYESIPHPPLKNRRNIILSRSIAPKQGVELAGSLTELKQMINGEDQIVHVIGGASLFDQLADDVDVLIQTVIDECFTGDTWMIPLDWGKFDLLSEEYKHSQTGINFTQKIWLK